MEAWARAEVGEADCEGPKKERLFPVVSELAPNLLDGVVPSSCNNCTDQHNGKGVKTKV